MNYIIYRDDELEHHGVLGMHWGVRRYQNEDGSYKPGAEGRYAPDGKPGVHTAKNRVKSALGIYKKGDDNPYVSKRRRKNREDEENEKQTGHTLKNKVKSKLGIYEEGDNNPYVSDKRRKNRQDEMSKSNKKKSEGEEEDEEISRRADALMKKNPNMNRRDAESDAEDEMIREAREKRKAEGKTTLGDRINERIEKKRAEREIVKQRKQEEKATKAKEKANKDFEKDLNRNWWKANNDAAKVFNKEIKTLNEKYKDTDFGEAGSKQREKYIREVDALWKQRYGEALDKRFGSKASSAGREADWKNYVTNYNVYSDALDEYKRRERAKHSDLSKYDALYHSESGAYYGIYFSQ